MQLTLDEIECLKGSEDLRRKIDEVLAFLNEKGIAARIMFSNGMEYYKDSGVLTLNLSLSIPWKNT
jgi:hypothetical protein